MKLHLIRHAWLKERTLGTLYVEDEVYDPRPFCFTVEDADRFLVGLPKVKGGTAIGTGVYEVIINFSARFQRQLPLLIGVPNFDGIRIHSGNTEDDTSGCILVGTQLSLESVRYSRLAMSGLMTAIKKGSRKGKITIEIDRCTRPLGLDDVLHKWWNG